MKHGNIVIHKKLLNCKNMGIYTKTKNYGNLEIYSNRGITECGHMEKLLTGNCGNKKLNGVGLSISINSQISAISVIYNWCFFLFG